MSKKFVFQFLVVLMVFLTLVGCSRIRGGGTVQVTVPAGAVQPSAPAGEAEQESQALPTQEPPTLQPQTHATLQPATAAPGQVENPASTAVQPAAPQAEKDDTTLDKSADDLGSSLDSMINELDSSDKLDDIK